MAPAVVGKMQGWSEAELCITLAFLRSTGSFGACITLVSFLPFLSNMLNNREMS